METVYELVQKMKLHRILYLSVYPVGHYIVVNILKIVVDIELDIIIHFILGAAYQVMPFLTEEIMCTFPGNARRTFGIDCVKQPFFHWQ